MSSLHTKITSKRRRNDAEAPKLSHLQDGLKDQVSGYQIAISSTTSTHLYKIVVGSMTQNRCRSQHVCFLPNHYLNTHTAFNKKMNHPTKHLLPPLSAHVWLPVRSEQSTRTLWPGDKGFFFTKIGPTARFGQFLMEHQIFQ